VFPSNRAQANNNLPCTIPHCRIRAPSLNLCVCLFRNRSLASSSSSVQATSSNPRIPGPKPIQIPKTEVRKPEVRSAEGLPQRTRLENRGADFLSPNVIEVWGPHFFLYLIFNGGLVFFKKFSFFFKGYFWCCNRERILHNNQHFSCGSVCARC